MIPPRNLSSSFVNLVDSFESLERFQRLIGIALEFNYSPPQPSQGLKAYQKYIDDLLILIEAYQIISVIETARIANHIKDVIHFLPADNQSVEE